MLSNILGIIIALLIGLALSGIWYSVIFLAVFIPIRQFTGGYHADSYIKCNIVFSVVVAVVLIYSNTVCKCWNITYSCLVFSAHNTILFFLSPLDNPNKPLSTDEKKKHKKIGLVISLFWFIAAIILGFFWLQASVTVTATTATVSLMLLIGLAKERRCMYEKGKLS